MRIANSSFQFPLGQFSSGQFPWGVIVSRHCASRTFYVVVCGSVVFSPLLCQAQVSNKTAMAATAQVSPKNKETKNQNTKLKRSDSTESEKNKVVTTGHEKAGVTSSTTTHQITHHANMLVPPPPPDVPATLSPMNPSSLYGSPYALFSIDTMTGESLQQKKTEMDKQWAESKGALEKVKQDAKDKKERAQQFVGLYNEGVVSRRELEAAQDEATRADKDVSDESARVADIEQWRSRVNERLNRLSKTGSKRLKGQSVKHSQSN